MPHEFLERLPREVYIELLDEDAPPDPGGSLKASVTKSDHERVVTFSVQFKDERAADAFMKAAERAATSETTFLHCRVPGSKTLALFKVFNTIVPINRSDLSMSWGSSLPAAKVWVVNVPALFAVADER